ncbi:MAG: SRPBCC domain-containing protein [Meiothermus sp.]|nr:SRPBCC domain-containing protein [Meiothermus sp.]
MSVKAQEVVLSQKVQAPVAQVYQAFTTATWLCEWFCYDAQLEAVPGGRFYAYWRQEKFYLMGEYLEVQPNKLISIRFQAKDDPEPSRVEVRFGEKKNQTEVSVEFKGRVSGQLEELWKNALINLKTTQERGHQAELLGRPMLGVLLGGNISAENAAQHNLPVSHGALISGTMAGLSAAEAGIRRGDVLVGLDGAEIAKFEDIGPVLSRRKVGDRIEAVFYRNGNRHTVGMELKPRRFHPHPANPAELADQQAPERAKLMKELEALFLGVGETQAAHRAAPEKWSANQVVAHLINVERDNQTLLASLVVGTELEVFTGNMEARVAATLKRFPSSKLLIQALEDTYLETLELIRALPESFLTHRASVARLQLLFEADAFHTRHHFDQIRTALEAARG